MARRATTMILGTVLALFFSAAPFAQQEFEKKQDEAMKKEAEALSKLAEDALMARGGPNDFSLTWVNQDFLQGPKGKEFVPFTFSLDPTKVNGGTLMVYWRVVPQAAAAAAADAKNAKRVEPVWERAGLVSVAGGTTPVRLSRFFEAPAGTYDVYIVTKEIPSEKAPKNSPPPKTVVLKQSVDVPDFWNGELATSSVVVVDKIEPLAAPLNNAQLIERPYARLGVFELTPAATTKFTKANQLSVFFLIYNPKNDAGKPDLNVEYVFCQAMAGNQPGADEPCKSGEKFYNKTAPQALNATTLPAQFDLNAGHMLPSEQAVPLSGFPAGDYRLEIKVTDKLGNQTVTRDVNFSVS
ncbi:MAG TPA: hypothetical protein VM818_02265 [Vicinamibacterales bacterium]|nr:hypothetical protein [Vicinamibacterales bacterium]